MTQFWLSEIAKNNIVPTDENLKYNIKNYDTKEIHFIRHLWSCDWAEQELPEKFKNNKELLDFLKNDPRNKNNKFFCEIYEEKILHYRAGSNWMMQSQQLHNDLTQKLKNILCK
jgi:hypothetical protein